MNRANLILKARASIEHGSKSFARASKLFSRQTRERAWLLYFWCRACDDLADGQDHGHGMSAIAHPDKTLAAMRMMTARAHGGEQTGNPPFDAFGVVAQECNIPKRLADDMIDGFALDARGWRPETEDDLLQYCYHVAGAVGCMMAIVMGVSARDHETLDRAHRTALVGLVNRLCALAGEYEASARVGASSLPFRSRWAVLAAAGIYGDIARTILSSDGASLDQRIYTSKATKLGWIVRAFGQALVNPARRDRQGLWTRARTV